MSIILAGFFSVENALLINTQFPNRNSFAFIVVCFKELFQVLYQLGQSIGFGVGGGNGNQATSFLSKRSCKSTAQTSSKCLKSHPSHSHVLFARCIMRGLISFNQFDGYFL